jgi:hypothetical protein
MGAFGHLEACEVMVDELIERSRRAHDLLDRVIQHGVGAEEAEDLRGYAENYAETGADEEVTRDSHERGLRREFDAALRSSDPDVLRRAAALCGELGRRSKNSAETMHLRLFGARCLYREEAVGRFREITMEPWAIPHCGTNVRCSPWPSAKSTPRVEF